MSDIDYNWWADWWRNHIGVNVIPAVGRLKIPKFPWLKDPRGNWQEEPIPIEIHEGWKKDGLFAEGMAIICGRVLHREDRKHLYLCAVDADNLMGINSMTGNLEELAKNTIVEQHANPNTAHILVYTTIPMWKKSSDTTNATMKEKMDANHIPALEMKGLGKHGIMYCTPSPHKDGSNYQILGTKEPATWNGVGDVVREICDRYKLGIGEDGKTPMKTLMKDDTKVYEGHNRHEAVMRVGENLIRRLPKMTEQEFNDLMMLKNERMCVPPLTDTELEKQKNDARAYIASKIAEERRLREIEKKKFGTEEFWKEANDYKRGFRPDGQFIKCLECKVMLDDDPFNRAHDGHKATFI